MYMRSSRVKYSAAVPQIRTHGLTPELTSPVSQKTSISWHKRTVSQLHSLTFHYGRWGFFMLENFGNHNKKYYLSPSEKILEECGVAMVAFRK